MVDDELKSLLLLIREKADRLALISRSVVGVGGELCRASNDLQDSLTALEASACRYLCKPPSPHLDVVPADRLVTLAGPGHGTRRRVMPGVKVAPRN